MSAGHSLGRGIGATAAYIGHGVVVAARATGQFGSDVVDGTAAGYDAKASQLALARQRALALRSAEVAARVPHSIAVATVPA